MSGVLAGILASKAREVEAMRARATPSARRFPEGPRPIAHDALARRAGEPLRVIAEIKRRSPSAGALSTALSPAERALAYARGGAAMISVLCDGPFFDGSYEHVTEARRALDDAGLRVPLLAKEFVIDGEQIACAAASGADAVLLIVRIVPAKMLRQLVALATARGLEALVEVATEEELATALDAGASVIGVNARDLDTLAMDADRAARVLAAIPGDRIAVHLSGVKDAADIRRIAASRAHAALVGEALMRLDDPSALLASMVAAAT